MGIFYDGWKEEMINQRSEMFNATASKGKLQNFPQTVIYDSDDNFSYVDSRLNILLIIGYLGILSNGALIIFSLSSWETICFLYVLGMVLSSIVVGLYYVLQNNLEETKKWMFDIFKRKEDELEEKRIGYERRYECQKEDLNKLLKETHPFCKVAELYKDAYLHVFGDTQPSHINIYQYKLMEYRIKVLQQVFPEIEKYIVEEDELETITAYLNDNRCNARYWLSDEEYEQCKNDEVRMEQLALDRYFSSNKRTKWEIGRDYEMFYGNYLYSKGYEVKYNGIEKGLLDNGIDLIACDEKVIWIIQCKNWGHFGTIYSKTVMQLYGAKEWYKKMHPDDGREIKAELVTSSNITDEAKGIAELLDVKCKPYMDIKRFPSIKLNVNSRGEKIYHLPFDRDYDRTEIKNKEEGYAVTIEEAKRRGFRRAYRNTN